MASQLLHFFCDVGDYFGFFRHPNFTLDLCCHLPSQNCKPSDLSYGWSFDSPLNPCRVTPNPKPVTMKLQRISPTRQWLCCQPQFCSSACHMEWSVLYLLALPGDELFTVDMLLISLALIHELEDAHAVLGILHDHHALFIGGRKHDPA